MRPPRTWRWLLIAAAVLALPACVGEYVPTTALPPTAGTTAAAVPQFGDRIEVRPGVFATTTARVTQFADQQTYRDGKYIDDGPKTDHVRITITYENRTTEPLAGMGTLNLGSSTLDGQVGTTAMWSDDDRSASLATLFPGRTGQLVDTVSFPPPWHRGDPIAVQVPVPALHSEGTDVQTMPLSSPVLVSGIPANPAAE